MCDTMAICDMTYFSKPPLWYSNIDLSRTTRSSMWRSMLTFRFRRVCTLWSVKVELINAFTFLGSLRNLWSSNGVFCWKVVMCSVELTQSVGMCTICWLHPKTGGMIFFFIANEIWIIWRKITSMHLKYIFTIFSCLLDCLLTNIPNFVLSKRMWQWKRTVVTGQIQAMCQDVWSPIFYSFHQTVYLISGIHHFVETSL